MRRVPRSSRALLLLAMLIAVPLLAAAQRGHGVPTRQAAIDRGRIDFATGSCISCHALYPISSAGAARDLTREGRARTLAWLRHEVRFPTSQRPPTPSGQADDLAIFLSSLR